MLEKKNISLFLTEYFKMYIDDQKRLNVPIMNLYKKAVDILDKSLIISVMENCNWSQSTAAAMLGLSRNTLSKKIKELNLSKERSL